MKKAMLDNLSGHCTGQILIHITKICFLDPGLKLPAFLTDNEKDELINGRRTRVTGPAKYSTKFVKFTYYKI